MNRAVHCQISWSATLLERMRSNDSLSKLATPVHFLNDDIYWPKQLWTAVILIPNAREQSSRCTIKMLLDDSPMVHFLTVGSRFELPRGRVIIATGVVVRDDSFTTDT